MSKLLKFNKLLTIEEARQLLAYLINQKVTLKDINQLISRGFLIVYSHKYLYLADVYLMVGIFVYLLYWDRACAISIYLAKVSVSADTALSKTESSSSNRVSFSLFSPVCTLKVSPFSLVTPLNI